MIRSRLVIPVLLFILAVFSAVLFSCGGKGGDLDSTPADKQDISGTEETTPGETTEDPNATEMPTLLTGVFMNRTRYCVAGLCEEGAAITIEGGRETVTLNSYDGQFAAEIFVETDEATLLVYAEAAGKNRSKPAKCGISANDNREGKPVYIGKDSQMIYKDAVPDYFGSNLFKEPQLTHIKNTVENFQKALRDAGLKTELIVMLAPNPGTIYPEIMSEYLEGRKVSNDSRLAQITELFRDSEVKFINPYDRMMAVRDDKFLYIKTDTHWNELGAYYGYAELFDYIGEKFPNAKTRPLSDFEIGTKDVNGGDICPMLEIDASQYREKYTTLRIKNPTTMYRNSDEVPYQEGVYHQYTEFKSDDAAKPTILMYRDSYSISMMSPMSETAGTTIFYQMWDYNFDMEYIKKINPDFLVVEKVERDAAVLLNIFDQFK